MNAFYANGGGKWIDRGAFEKPGQLWPTIAGNDFQVSWNNTQLIETAVGSGGVWAWMDKD